MCAKIRTLLRKGYRVFDGKNGVLNELEFFFPMQNACTYDDLPEDAQLQLRMLECDVYLEQYPDATPQEIDNARSWVQEGFSIFEQERHFGQPFERELLCTEDQVKVLHGKLRLR